MFLKRFFLLVFAPFFLNGCFYSTEAENDTIIPEKDFSLVDAYFEKGDNYLYLVFKNNHDYILPQFHADYLITCNNDLKEYNSEYFFFDKSEQIIKTFYIGTKPSECKFSISTIRAVFDDFDSWTGKYDILVTDSSFSIHQSP